MGKEVLGEQYGEFGDECAVCLIDQDWDEEDAEDHLKSNYDEYFKEFLGAKCTFPEVWPENRSWIFFNDWFKWYYSSMIWDSLPDKRIRRERL